MPTSATSANGTGSAAASSRLSCGRGRVEVGIERAGRERGGDARRRSEGVGRGRQAEHDVGAARPPRGRSPRSGSRSGRRAGSHARTSQPAATSSAAISAPGLAEPEHRDLHQLAFDERPDAPAGRRTARPRRSARASPASRALALERERQHLVDARGGQRHRAVAVQHDEVARARSPRRRRRPARRAPDVALRRALRAHPARPDRQADRRELVEVADRRRRRGTPRRPASCACVASSSPMNAIGAGSVLVSTSTSPGCAWAISACTIVLSPRRADGGARGPGDARARHDLRQREVDDARAAGGLVDGRDAEARERGVVGHSASCDDGDLAHERLGVADAAAARDAPRVVRAVLAALGVVLLEVALRAHRLHRRELLRPDGRDVEERRRHEPAELGLVRLEDQELGRPDRLERARHARAARELARLHRRVVRDAVVGVERIERGVREHRAAARARASDRSAARPPRASMTSG